MIAVGKEESVTLLICRYTACDSGKLMVLVTSLLSKKLGYRDVYSREYMIREKHSFHNEKQPPNSHPKKTDNKKESVCV